MFLGYFGWMGSGSQAVPRVGACDELHVLHPKHPGILIILGCPSFEAAFGKWGLSFIRLPMPTV